MTLFSKLFSNLRIHCLHVSIPLCLLLVGILKRLETPLCPLIQYFFLNKRFSSRGAKALKVFAALKRFHGHILANITSIKPVNLRRQLRPISSLGGFNSIVRYEIHFVASSWYGAVIASVGAASINTPGTCSARIRSWQIGFEIKIENDLPMPPRRLPCNDIRMLVDPSDSARSAIHFSRSGPVST